MLRSAEDWERHAKNTNSHYYVVGGNTSKTTQLNDKKYYFHFTISCT